MSDVSYLHVQGPRAIIGKGEAHGRPSAGGYAVKLSNRLVAEGIGSLLLTATVIGSGIMAERLAAGNTAIALLANTGATVAVLATLIALLGPISGAHFNPAVSFVEALRGKLTLRQTVAYVIVQIAGCCLGALLRTPCSRCPCSRHPCICG